MTCFVCNAAEVRDPRCHFWCDHVEEIDQVLVGVGWPFVEYFMTRLQLISDLIDSEVIFTRSFGRGELLKYLGRTKDWEIQVCEGVTSPWYLVLGVRVFLCGLTRDLTSGYWDPWCVQL